MPPAQHSHFGVTAGFRSWLLHLLVASALLRTVSWSYLFGLQVFLAYWAGVGGT